MDHSEEPPHDNPDPALRLPRSIYYQLLHTLRGLLPPPVTDTPEDHARRDDAAIAQVAAMLPINADEANIAAQCVAARAQAMDSLRLARVASGIDLSQVLRCTAQATGMMRQANGARSLLLRVQAERRRIEADGASANNAAWTEHCTISWMTQVASGTSEPVPPRPPLDPAPDPAQEPDAEPARDLTAEAELYAQLYPDRAALIRAHGMVPADVRFGPPDDALARAIVAGRTPALLEADRIKPRDAVSPHAL